MPLRSYVESWWSMAFHFVFACAPCLDCYCCIIVLCDYLRACAASLQLSQAYLCEHLGGSPTLRTSGTPADSVRDLELGVCASGGGAHIIVSCSLCPPSCLPMSLVRWQQLAIEHELALFLQGGGCAEWEQIPGERGPGSLLWRWQGETWTYVVYVSHAGETPVRRVH